MAVLTETEINEIVKDRAQFNTANDGPVTTAELLRFVNDAYSDVWELSGGKIKEVAHADAWFESTTNTTGDLHGRLTDIGELIAVFDSAADAIPVDGNSQLTRVEIARINHLRNDLGYGPYSAHKLYASWRLTSGVTLGATASSWSSVTKRVTSDIAGALANVRVGAAIGGTVTGIANGTLVTKRISNSIVEMAAITITSTGSPTFTDPGTNRLKMALWPPVASRFVPIMYLSQFVPLVAAGTPDVNDLESRDIALLAAVRIAPLVGKAHLVPSIMADISDRTAKALERKLSALLEAKQNT